MTRLGKAKRLAIAVTGSLAINAALLCGLAWREYRMTLTARMPDVVEVYLPPLVREQPRKPKPPPEPPPPPPPVEAPQAAATAPAGPAPRQPLIAPSADTPTMPIEAAAAPQLKMGCMGQAQGSRSNARQAQCMDQAGRNTFEMVNRIGPPDPRRENYAVLTPAGAVPPSPEQIVPGVHLKTSMPAPGVGRDDGAIGGGISIGYGPEDKYFLPFQGSSVKHVFKPDEIYAVPTPMR